MKPTSVVTLLMIFGGIAFGQTPATPVDSHIAAARTAAGLDYRATFVNLCLPSAPRGGGAGPTGRGATATPPTPDRATWYAPPFKVFDNLYWLGTRQHSSWALQTSAGIIIIDTNFAWATGPEIIEGLNKLGLNPSDIKYVIISHAHGDHDQGAAELQKRYGAQVVMGAPDWDATLEASRHSSRVAFRSAMSRWDRRAEADPGRHHYRNRRYAWSHAGYAVVRFPGERSGPDSDGRVFRRHADRRLRDRRRAMGRIHRIPAEDCQSSRRCARQRHHLQPQRVRRCLHQSAPDRRTTSTRRRPSVCCRNRQRPTLLHRHGRMRDRVEASGRCTITCHPNESRFLSKGAVR